MDGGEPKAMSPLDTLEAHQKGAAVMAASPDGRFMATGGADGLVCLWMVYENQVSRQLPDVTASMRSRFVPRRVFGLLGLGNVVFFLLRYDRGVS